MAVGTGSVEIDESRWPIVVMKLSGDLSTEDYVKLFERSETIIARQQPHVGIVDLRELTSIADAKQREFIAQRIKEIEQRHGDPGLGNVMIVKSALLRGVLTAVEWLRGRQKRDIWVATMDEALEVATQLCNKQGLLELVHTPKRA